MYGTLEVTSAFAPVGWLIVATAVASVATLILQRDRRVAAPDSPACDDGRQPAVAASWQESVIERWAA